MASAKKTRDHNKIRRWAEARGGQPAFVEGTGGLLRIDFDNEPSAGEDDRLQRVSWDDFFRELDDSDIEFLYSPEQDSRFNKFLRRNR